MKNKTNNTLEALGYLVIGKGFEGRIITMLIVVNSNLTLKGYTVVSHSESPGYGADIVGNDFGVSTITDLSGFDSVAGITKTSNGIYDCFEIVSQRVASDFGGGLDD
jgi:Na+-transporting NADH:ubiquinone oxidoreductase subunit NqrC